MYTWFQTAMMAQTVASTLSSRSPNSIKGRVASEGTDDHTGGVDEEGDLPFCKSCKNYGHQRRSSRLCLKNKKSKYYEGKTVEILRNRIMTQQLLPM
jgi:hypothetical protein